MNYFEMGRMMRIHLNLFLGILMQDLLQSRRCNNLVKNEYLSHLCLLCQDLGEILKMSTSHRRPMNKKKRINFIDWSTAQTSPLLYPGHVFIVFFKRNK